MANLIQIKRSDSTAAPTSLTPGELAYSFLSTSNSLFIGNTSAGGVIRIGGGKYIWLHQANTSQPGALTANAVVITNGNSYVTEWKTNKLVVGTDGTTVNVTSISTAANSTQLGASVDGSNTELVSSYAIKTYVDSKSSAASIVATNTQILYGNNNTYGQSANFTFDYVTNSLVVGNSTVNTVLSQTAITTATGAFGNVTSTTKVTVGANVTVNTSAVSIGNSTVNTLITSSTIGGNAIATLGNTTVNGVLTVTSNANISQAINVGANLTINTSTIFIGNSTVNTTITSAGISGNQPTSSGDTSITGTLSVTGNTTLAQVNATSLNVGANVNVNVTSIAVGNSTGNVLITQSGIVVGNSTVGTVNAFALNVIGTANATLHTAGANVSMNVTSIAVGNSTGNVLITQSGIVVGNTTVGTVNAASFNSVGNILSTFANNVNVTGTANITFVNVHQDLSVSGNLYVTGSVTSINTTSLAITDSLIQLAKDNNTTPDILDIGLYGNYGVDGTSGNHKHTGFFRDASDGIWKLFTGLATSPTTIVDTSDGTFAFGTMQGYLKAGGTTSSGLIANSTTVSITANSTMSVAFVANTLSLSTALAGTSGGTGLASFTAEDLLVANSSNGFRKLGVGTDGYILQTVSGVVQWSALDGGTF